MTLQQSDDKKARAKLLSIAKAVKLQFSFKKIKTVADLFKAVGKNPTGYFPSELSKTVDFHDVKEFLSDLHIELETRIYLRDNPPLTDTPNDHTSTTQTTTTSNTPNVAEVSSPQQSGTTNEPVFNIKTFIQSPNENVKYYSPQPPAIQETFDKIVKDKEHGLLLIGGTGVGKTVVLGGILRRLIDMQWHKTIGSISPWPYLYVTKASIVEQTKQDVRDFFNLTTRDVLVINIEQLRSKAGELWIDEEIVVEGGQERTLYKWRPYIHPALIIWDECQVLMNYGSTQHKIGCAVNDIPEDNVYQIFSSATPFFRVSGAKCFAVSTRIEQNLSGIDKIPITNENWKAFASKVAFPADPEETSVAAVDRLMDVLDDYVVRIKNTSWQFHAKNQVQMIEFKTEAGQQYYFKAEDNYLKKKAKLAAKKDSGQITGWQFNVSALVAMLQYRIAAEGNPDRIDYIAGQMYEAVSQGYAAVGAWNFKGSIVKLVRMLCETYGVPRDDISLIWGGGPQKASEKQKSKAAIEANDDLMKALEDAGLTMEDLQLDDVEAKSQDDEIPEYLRLGTQSIQERQREIERFQSGKSKYCFYTFKAGGVGLSLHHSDRFTKEKVRRKESGYAVEEDIPNIPTRPRKTWVAPTWSPAELVQGVGRVPRLTSLSDTIQYLTFFKGTIEERVAKIVGLKLRCLSKVVRQMEDWEAFVVGDKPMQLVDIEHKQLYGDAEETDVAVAEPNGEA